MRACNFYANPKKIPKSQIPNPNRRKKPTQQSSSSKKVRGNHSVIAIDNTGFRAAAVPAAAGSARHGHEAIDAESDEGQDDEEDDDDDGDNVVFLHFCETIVCM